MPSSVTPRGTNPTDRSLLCVDLDGTLISGDVLWESLILLLKRDPCGCLASLGCLIEGRARFKRRLADRVMPDPATLPYRESLLVFLREERAAGRRLLLATASDERIGQAVADHLGLFDGVIGSDGSRNLKGRTKLAAIRERCQHEGFDYAGDSAADLPIWAAARHAYLVAPSQRVLRRLRTIREPERVFETPVSGLRAGVRALRPHQWAKNLLLFLPLVLAHKLTDFQRLTQVGTAFLVFCLCASAVYLLNDILDVEADRQHPVKRRRAFANGEITIPAGLVAFLGLIATSFTLSALLLPWGFTLALTIYLALTTAYSVFLKRKLLLDVLALAGLYTHRVVAGSLAAQVVLTPWLLAFSMFLFLSLAFAKRYTELTLVRESEGKKLVGRAYVVQDLAVIESVGPTSGYLAVLVLALYINSELVHSLYARPSILWGICPILLYWITRVWFFAGRCVLHDDPVLFALRDRLSFVLGALAAALIAAATL